MIIRKNRLEPKLVTEPKLLHILDELIKHESIFLHPEFGTIDGNFEKMIEDEFWEVGASGRRYSRQYVLVVLGERSKNPHDDIGETRDFHCLEIAKDNYLLTYTLSQGERITRRATIWRHYNNSDWKIVYHQGTIVEDK